MPKKTTIVEEEVTSSDDAVIKSTDINPPRLKVSFADLNKDELVAAANMFGTETDGNESVIRADLAENGVTWEMYVKAFRLPGHETIPDAEPVPPVQVELTDEDEVDEQEVVVVQEVVTAPPVALAQDQKYLVKFIGDNPYFEFKRYKFTNDNPYAVMPAGDAQAALVTEPKKFRQAFPAELTEFYG